MKTKILFIRHLLNDGNDLAKRIFIDEYQQQKTTWSKQILNYIKQLKLTLTKISTKSTISLSELIQDWDTERWLTGMKDKQTLAIYRRFKTKIKE